MCYSQSCSREISFWDSWLDLDDPESNEFICMNSLGGIVLFAASESMLVAIIGACCCVISMPSRQTFEDAQAWSTDHCACAALGWVTLESSFPLGQSRLTWTQSPHTPWVSNQPWVLQANTGNHSQEEAFKNFNYIPFIAAWNSIGQ